MNEVKKSKKKKRKINKILTIILLVIVLVFFTTLFYINIIPTTYLIIALIIMLAFLFGIILLNLNKKRIFRLFGYLLTVILSVILIIVEVYLINTLGFLFGVTSGNYALKSYNVLVLKENSISNLENLDNEKIGIHINNTDVESIKDKINKKIDVKYEEYDDSETLVNGLINEEVDGIILEDSEIELLKENDYTKYESLENIYEIEIKQSIKDLMNAVNINKEPFNVYISGIDTFGKINSSSRSDVNIVLTVNPKTEKILITWIPRDYYVNINTSKYKDKLTHAGIYGIDSSIYAIEKLLDTEINYYVKVNFTSIIKVVDLLEGISVYNDETITLENGHVYKAGNITLNGEQTLEFVRERKGVTGGDLGRGRNQIKVLEALMNKAMSPSIIKSYNSLLKSLDGTFVTNMNQNTMMSFIKKELNSPSEWQIESNTLTGSDSLEYTYTYKKSALYVMNPDKDSIAVAKNKIEFIMEN